MNKAQKAVVAAVPRNSGVTVALWGVVITLIAATVYGVGLRLWEVSWPLCLLVAGLFIAIGVATPNVVRMAERAKGSMVAACFFLAALLAVGDWIGGFNFGLMVEQQTMSKTWKDAETALEAQHSDVQAEIDGLTVRLRTSRNALLDLKPEVVTCEKCPLTRAAAKETFQTESQKLTNDISVITSMLTEQREIKSSLPVKAEKVKLFSHVLLGVFMGALQIATLFGFWITEGTYRRNVKTALAEYDVKLQTLRKTKASKRRSDAIKQGHAKSKAKKEVLLPQNVTRLNAVGLG